MNRLVAKGFKQGGQASITSAIQRMLKIGYGSTLGPQFSLLFLCTVILHLSAARVWGCHSETFYFTGKSIKCEMVTQPDSWAANKARTSMILTHPQIVTSLQNKGIAQPPCPWKAFFS